MKITIHLFLGFLCLATLGPKAKAVIPAPDGGYPRGNTAEGQNALLSLTTGAYNTGLGYYSLRSNTMGNFNTAVGAGALFATDGNPTPNGDASNNCAFGVLTLFANTTGARSSAFGSGALALNTTGGNNTACGYQAMFNNNTGNNNTAFGYAALYNNTNGYGNVAYGYGALGGNSAGQTNTAVGIEALDSNTTGSNNLALGPDAGKSVTTASNVICIGSEIMGENVSNSCYIGSIFGQTAASGAAVYINSAGKLGTNTSSRRFKQDVRPMDKISEALFALHPVTFRYKKEIDSSGTSQFGLVAEDVEKVNPDLVVRDREGKPYSVRYDQVNAMLLNEFLKEHKAFVEEHRTVEELKKQIAALTAGLERVSAQLEVSKAAPQTVLNNQ